MHMRSPGKGMESCCQGLIMSSVYNITLQKNIPSELNDLRFLIAEILPMSITGDKVRVSVDLVF